MRSPARKVLPALIFYNLLAPAQAEVYAPGFAWPYHMQAPYYHSGTNCRAGIVIVVDPIEPATVVEMLEARLYIAGNLVKSWTNPAPLEGGRAVFPLIGLEARFDSTHFPTGHNIRVRMEATDTAGRTYSGHYDALAKNAATVWQHRTMNGHVTTNSAPVVQSFLQVFLNSVQVTTQWWSGEDVMAKLKDSTVHYVNTHGGIQYYDDNSGSEEESDIAVYGTSNFPNVYVTYAEERPNTHGTGYAPYNSTGNPPVSFAFIDSCNSCTDNEFTAMFWPFQDHYGDWVVNQAVLGWAVYAADTSSMSCNTFVWDSLVAKRKTVWDTRRKFFEWNASEQKVYFFDANNELQLVLSEEQLRIWGDFYTRVRGVYTGDNSLAEEVWYR